MLYHSGTFKSLKVVATCVPLVPEEPNSEEDIDSDLDNTAAPGEGGGVESPGDTTTTTTTTTTTATPQTTEEPEHNGNSGQNPNKDKDKEQDETGRVQTFTINEHSSITFGCPEGKEFGSIDFASYGTIILFNFLVTCIG